MQVCGICALYNYMTRTLQVYGEFDISNALPSDVINEASLVSGSGMTVMEWTANDEVFKDIEKSTKTAWHHYRKAGIKLKRSYEYDEMGSIMLANQMFSNNACQIHATNCKRLFAQLREWRTRGGKPEKNLMFARAFSQLVTRLKRKKLINLREERMGEKEYGRIRRPQTRDAVRAY